ncbi:MAG: AMP-binding protein [Planctomycetes bacterium]|nr:AMP-binding protein [Planctomycetota bacterium]
MTTSVAELPVQAACNIARLLPQLAATRGDQRAVVMQRGGQAVTFAELNAFSDRIAHGLIEYGFARGDKVVLAVKPSPEFFALTFALWKIGAVPVMIDPGMGRKNALACVADVKAVALVGIPLVHLLSKLHPRSFATLKRRVTIGRRWLWGGKTLKQLAARERGAFTPVNTRADELAAILFTSGATGISKGVEYEHGMFDGQVTAIRDYFGIQPGEIDVPCFPLFALFTLGMGCTVVVPDMDFSRPASVAPQTIVAAINNHKATMSFASPAVWRRVAGILPAIADNVSPASSDQKLAKPAAKMATSRAAGTATTLFPTLLRIISAGASVSADVMQPFVGRMAPGGEFHVPYGATESLPLSCIDASTVIGQTATMTAQGAGTCVGKQLNGVEVRIAKLTRTRAPSPEDPLTVGDFKDCARGEIGEILVSSAVTTRRYYNRPQQTAESKVYDRAAPAFAVPDNRQPTTDNRFYHRIGDVGYLDGQGRLWFCGRGNHVVHTAGGPVYPDRVEPIFNGLVGARGSVSANFQRTALAGVGKAPNQAAVLIVETDAGTDALRAELLALAAKHETTRAIKQVLFHPGFPVDVRHNAKIDRLALSKWAETQKSLHG